MRPTAIPTPPNTLSAGPTAPANDPPAGEIEFALLAPVSPTLEGALLAMLGNDSGLTGYLALQSDCTGRGGFLLMLRTGADRVALSARLAPLGVPADQLLGRVFPPQAGTEIIADNLEMLIGLMNGQTGARRIAPERRAQRRAA
ncbi:MAG TPA: hypothetical protein VL860_11005 [Planctomycetota bacterium]|nr:hypothetical protein [Planctomycetota bacterium]